MQPSIDREIFATLEEEPAHLPLLGVLYVIGM